LTIGESDRYLEEERISRANGILVLTFDRLRIFRRLVPPPLPPRSWRDAEARRNRFERIRKVRKANRPPRMTLANRGQAENKRDESPRLASSYLASSRLDSLASSVSFVSTRRGYTTATAELTSSFLFSFFLAPRTNVHDT